MTAEPSEAQAVAISQATTPPPMTTSRAGTASAAVASRLVHAPIPSSPGTDGRAASVPGLRTTARRAESVRSPPAAVVTATRRSPASRPWPRTRVMPAPRSQSAWPLSSPRAVNRSRRARTAAGSRAPVTASRAPATERADSRAAPGRSRALLGTHAQ
ncbi:hypothetical protein GCM10020254_16940 [Streptomyces goshikiensis]